MSTAYFAIRNEYLDQAWTRSAEVLAACLPAVCGRDGLQFRAFGEDCLLTRTDILLSGNSDSGPMGLLIAMYASAVPDTPVELQPLKAFKEIPHSMPYQAAFAANAEQILVPHVARLQAHRDHLVLRFSGQINQDAPTGDFSFTLWPLPRIPLYYIFNLADEDFPASVTCLFAANANLFMPLDGLADVAEYTGKKLIAVLNEYGGSGT